MSPKIPAPGVAIDSLDPDDDGQIVNLRPGFCFDEPGCHCFGIGFDETVDDYFGRLFLCDCEECQQEFNS